jgi:hypothetical protein
MATPYPAPRSSVLSVHPTIVADVGAVAGSGQALSLGRYYPDSAPAQAPADVAVVIPTILRREILNAIECVYRQDLGGGRVQLLIGVDVNAERAVHLERLLARRPDHVSVLVLTLPYSTSTRHGGLHPAADGGALRTILTFAANARYVAYLDDDNDWAPDHLQALLAAVKDKVWAYSLRTLVDGATGANLGVDRWDSVGPGRGRFQSEGGFVDPSCLMVDKLTATSVLWTWSDPVTPTGKQADRRFFRSLTQWPGGEVGRPTVRYKIRESNVLREIMKQGLEFP